MEAKAMAEAKASEARDRAAGMAEQAKAGAQSAAASAQSAAAAMQERAEATMDGRASISADDPVPEPGPAPEPAKAEVAEPVAKKSFADIMGELVLEATADDDDKASEALVKKILRGAVSAKTTDNDLGAMVRPAAPCRPALENGLLTRGTAGRRAQAAALGGPAHARAHQDDAARPHCGIQQEGDACPARPASATRPARPWLRVCESACAEAEG
jgi:hypothetical protein